jgi:hypothetical protein
VDTVRLTLGTNERNPGLLSSSYAKWADSFNFFVLLNVRNVLKNVLLNILLDVQRDASCEVEPRASRRERKKVVSKGIILSHVHLVLHLNVRNC